MKRNKAQNLKRELRKNRARAKISGTSLRPRFSVFRSNRYLYVQLIDDSNRKTLFSSSTWGRTKKNKTESARLLGAEVAEIAKKEGIKAVVFDRGSYRYLGRVKAVAEGAREKGLQF